MIVLVRRFLSAGLLAQTGGTNLTRIILAVVATVFGGWATAQPSRPRSSLELVGEMPSPTGSEALRTYAAMPSDGADISPRRAVTPPASVTIAYSVLRARVERGDEVLVAFGVPAPAGYVTLSDPPSGIGAGLWRCWNNGRDAVMSRVADGLHRVAERIEDRVAGYRARWTHPPDLRAHLMSEMHGFSFEALRTMSVEEMERLHDDDHDKKSGRMSPSVPAQQYAPSPVPQYQPQYGLYQYQFGGSYSGVFCPPGRR